MTTRNNSLKNDPKEDQPEDFIARVDDAIIILLEPYEAVTDRKDADKLFTTNEIIQALETHYGWPQGDSSFITPNAGKIVMDKLKSLGFTYINTGDLQLQWMMKKRTSA